MVWIEISKITHKVLRITAFSRKSQGESTKQDYSEF
ncbi:hypothetical protein NIES3275_53760 [Microchaete diplosiphon NIES-3275]|nr:hypothetical protein NIES3275_53760 [Microchaete diplosiphon NIES-3275]